MSNASSKKASSEPTESASSNWLWRYITSPRSGNLAVLEFIALIILDIAATKHQTSTTLAVVSILNLLMWGLIIAHSIVTMRRRQWEAWFSVMIGILIYFIAQTVASLVVAIASHTSESSLESGSFGSIGAQFSFVLAAETLTLAALYGYMRIVRIKLLDIGLRRPKWSDLAYGIITAVGYYIALALVLGIIHALIPSVDLNQKQELGFDSVHGSSQLFLTFLSLVVLPPIAEEIVVRGFLYSSIKKAVPLIWAVLLTSALFAVAHLPEGGANGPFYVGAAATFVLSLFLILLREKTKGLYAGMTLHAINNGVAFVALFATQLK